MSTRQTGNRHENSVMEMAEALGYATFAARGSRGPVDVVAFEVLGEYNTCGCGDCGVRHGWKPSLVIQVGTTNKPIASTLAELESAPRPIGSLCIVARRHKHKTSKRISWTWHSAEGKFDSLAALLDARR